MVLLILLIVKVTIKHLLIRVCVAIRLSCLLSGALPLFTLHFVCMRRHERGGGCGDSASFVPRQLVTDELDQRAEDRGKYQIRKHRVREVA